MKKKESGQALVEFAIVFILLVVLFVAIIDVGKAIYMNMNINLISQEAVRLGGLGYDDTDIYTYIDENFKLGNYDNLDITINPADTERESGEYMSINLSYPMTYIMPGLGLVLPETVHTESTIRVE